MSNIFKAYDVRGIYPEEIDKDLAFRIGGATVHFLQAKTLVVGEDARASSPTLRGAVIDSATKAGAKVYYIGQCTTPLFYFSVNKLKAGGGIMVTASHNPPRYGGLKIVSYQNRPVGSETGLKEIERLSHENLEPAQKEGTTEEVNLVSDYVNFLVEKSGISPSKVKNLKLVIDAGNGMTPLVLTPLLAKLGIVYRPMYFEIDCNFPNHSPDISKIENLSDLKNKVLQTKSDLGIAFDGDGDRIAFVDKDGNKINSGYILALLFKAGRGFFHTPSVTYDLRFSRSVKDFFSFHGVRSRVGHTFIKEVMRKHEADIAGELSGHFFFKEMSYAESSVLAMLKILKIVAESGEPISELIKPFQKYYHSGEINISIEPGLNRQEQILEIFKNKYKTEEADELDGITVDLWDKEGWWFNVRPSNTEPVLRLVVEAKTKELMEQKVKELTEEIKSRTF